MADQYSSYGLPTSSLARINQKLNQMKAAGRVIMPWQMQAMYEAELADASRRSLEMNRFAEQKRQSDLLYKLKKKEIDQNANAAAWSGLGNMATSALMTYMLK